MFRENNHKNSKSNETGHGKNCEIDFDKIIAVMFNFIVIATAEDESKKRLGGLTTGGLNVFR